MRSVFIGQLYGDLSDYDLKFLLSKLLLSRNPEWFSVQCILPSTRKLCNPTTEEYFRLVGLNHRVFVSDIRIDNFDQCGNFTAENQHYIATWTLDPNVNHNPQHEHPYFTRFQLPTSQCYAYIFNDINIALNIINIIVQQYPQFYPGQQLRFHFPKNPMVFEEFLPDFIRHPEQYSLFPPSPPPPYPGVYPTYNNKPADNNNPGPYRSPGFSRSPGSNYHYFQNQQPVTEEPMVLRRGIFFHAPKQPLMNCAPPPGHLKARI